MSKTLSKDKLNQSKLTDLAIIQQLEQEIGRKLGQIDLDKITSSFDNGYVVDENNNVIGLNLDELELVNIPNALLNLKNLHRLSLYSNKIYELPDSFGDLNKLSYLDLQNNQLKELPESFGQLQNLSLLLLNENPLVTPPIDIAERGIESIRNYFKFKLKPSIQTLYNLDIQSIEIDSHKYTTHELNNITRNIDREIYAFNQDILNPSLADSVKFNNLIHSIVRNTYIRIMQNSPIAIGLNITRSGGYKYRNLDSIQYHGVDLVSYDNDYNELLKDTFISITLIKSLTEIPKYIAGKVLEDVAYSEYKDKCEKLIRENDFDIIKMQRIIPVLEKIISITYDQFDGYDLELIKRGVETGTIQLPISVHTQLNELLKPVNPLYCQC